MRLLSPLWVPTLWAALSCLGLGACSSVPEPDAGRASQVLSEGPKLPLRWRVAPPEFELAAQEAPKGYQPREVVEGQAMADTLARWVDLNALGRQARSTKPLPVALADARARHQAYLDEAWKAGDDVLVELAFKEFQTRFVEHNAWWIPNIVNWAFWLVPAWFVATEVYELSFTCELTLRSVDSRQVLHRASLPIAVRADFDEFDRGWQFFGFIYPLNDVDNWRQIVRALLPAATRELGRSLCQELASGFAPQATSLRKRMGKTLGLVVGLGHYQDTLRYPPLPYARSDAESIRDALSSCGLEPRHLRVLLGKEATRAGVEAALDELGARLRPGDQLLVYVAGYGSRDAQGKAQLVLYEADAAQAGRLNLEALGARLAKLPGAKLVALDLGFDGQGRSIAPATPTQGKAAEAWPDPQASLVLATQRGAPLRAPRHLSAGLFSYHLARGLKGRADRDHDGTLDLSELFGHAQRGTVVDSAYFGTPQRPRIQNPSLPFVLSRTATK